MLYLDGGRVFTILLSLEDISLHGYVDVDSQLEGQLEVVAERLQGEEKLIPVKNIFYQKNTLN